MRPLVESEYTSDIQQCKPFQGKDELFQNSETLCQDVYFNMSKKNLRPKWMERAVCGDRGGRIKGLSGAEGDLTCTYRKCKTSLVHTESAKLDAKDEDVEL